MTRQPRPVLWLKKSRTDVCCHCRCTSGIVGGPGQLDCPWCGCGWMFFCIKCRKGFTFARAVRIKRSLDDLAAQDWRAMFGSEPSKKQLAPWSEWFRDLAADLEEGEEYVYLDGIVFPTHAKKVRFTGLHSRHALRALPQVLALSRPVLIETTLADPVYWSSREVRRRTKGAP